MHMYMSASVCSEFIYISGMYPKRNTCFVQFVKFEQNSHLFMENLLEMKPLKKSAFAKPNKLFNANPSHVNRLLQLVGCCHIHDLY